MQPAKKALPQPEIAPLYRALERLYTRHGCTVTDVPILQELDPFLEAAGEDLRRRLFTTTGAFGEDLCLRPEFTIPVCLQYLAQALSGPQRYCYLGPVFRQDADAPYTTLQSGVEHLGKSISPIDEDAEIMMLAFRAVSTVSPSLDLTLKLDEPALFHALLDSLHLPVTVKNRLIRCFGKKKLEADDLNSLFSRAEPLQSSLSSDFENPSALEAAIKDRMQTHGLSATAGRHPKDIAARFAALYGSQEEGFSESKSAHAAAVLNAYLSLEGSAESMPDRLRAFEKEYNLSFGTALDHFQALLLRFRRIAHDILPERFVFSARFNRPLDYYTGFVFEIFADDPSHPVAGGGRYDRLLEILGARKSTPAVGFSIWLDRLSIGQDTKP